MNLEASDQLHGHAWEWAEVISRGPEPTPAAPKPAADATCTCDTGDKDAEPCAEDDCEIAFRMEVGWP